MEIEFGKIMINTMFESKSYERKEVDKLVVVSMLLFYHDNFTVVGASKSVARQTVDKAVHHRYN